MRQLGIVGVHVEVILALPSFGAMSGLSLQKGHPLTCNLLLPS